MINEDEEEEEEAQLRHRERRSKKHHDDATMAQSSSTLPPNEDEIDLTAKDLDLDQIINDACRFPFTLRTDNDIDPFHHVPRTKGLRNQAPEHHQSLKMRCIVPPLIWHLETR